MTSKPKTRYGLTHSIAIWLLVFCAGWFVMLTELVGARVLAPYFGNTIYVWGSVIAIFLLALSIGYALGGRLTQILGSPHVPAALAAIAGIFVALTPLYQDKLSAALLSSGLDLRWAALFAATLLYGIPMVLLGAVSPYCIQLATKTHLEVGTRAGTLAAISTTGSFLGCLVTAFVLIPSLSLPPIAVYGGLSMIGVAAVVSLALMNRITMAGCLAVALIVVMASSCLQYFRSSSFSQMKAYQYPLTGEPFSDLTPEQMGPVLIEAQQQALEEAAKHVSSPMTTLFDTETPYHRIQIVQEGPVRQMVFGQAQFRAAQSIADLRELSWHVAEYTHLAFAGLLYRPAPERVLVIGVGGGTIPRALELAVPGVKVDAVDIDPTVIRLAQEYFYWRPSKNVRVYAQDGRSFLNWALMNKQPKYDWIILDAYSDDYIPFHLTTAEFINTAKRMLTPDGILATNLRVDDDLYGYQARTFEMLFGNAHAFVGHRSGNIILLSQNGRNEPLTREQIGEAARRLQLPEGCNIDPRFMVSCLFKGRNWPEKGPLLVDVWAPVENLMK